MTDEEAEQEAWVQHCDNLDRGAPGSRHSFNEGFHAGLAHERARQAELNTTYVFVTPESVGSHFRRELFKLRAAGHTEEQERRGLNSHATNAHRVAALDHAGFCWLHPGEMAPGCGCPWSATSPSGARERAETRLAELTRQAERLRALERVVEASKEFAEWHGGCPHHPDDCPRELELCRIVHRLETAFAALDRPAPIEPEPDQQGMGDYVDGYKCEDCGSERIVLR